MLLQDSRRDTRVGSDGAIVPLEEQDRARWNRDAIVDGLVQLDAALAIRQRGPYQLQAAIAALHAKSARAEDTDWQQISALYIGLLREQPSAVVELNAAVAHAMAEGLESGLDWINQLTEREELSSYYLLPAAKADLLRRLGRYSDAREAYCAAIVLVQNPAERKYLEKRLATCRD